MKKLYVVLIFVHLVACGDKEPKLEATKESIAKVSLNAPPESDSGSPGQIERKLIKTGNVTLKVEDVKKTKTAIDKICIDFKAYVSNEEQNNLGDRFQHTLVIRIPADNFDPLTKLIEALASKVESKSVTVHDVTEEFIDAEARLKTKKDLAARYHEILKAAKSVADILEVEKQIGILQAEIESVEGRLKYMKDQVSFSTLDLTYYEVIGVDFGFGSKFVNAIKHGWDNLLLFIVGLMNLWPFLILFGFGYWLFSKWTKRRKSE